MKTKALPPVKYLEGEVIWAKFNRRPWWPCQVTVHPVEGDYHRIKGKYTKTEDINHKTPIRNARNHIHTFFNSSPPPT